MLQTRFSISGNTQNRASLKRRAVAATLAASLACLLPGVSHAEPAASSLQVQLPTGVIEGASMQVGETELRAFKGIPYAAPPVGALRWKEPQPVAQWAGVRNASQFGPRCMQFTPNDTFKSRANTMSEDCLYLNIWTPAVSDGEKLPVLVYLHGGAFTLGDGSDPRWDGANLAARGIVTVTLNYRLGVFGFLALQRLAEESPHGATGNYGLLDQTAALTWVRENIARFGGDPQKVTIAGDSSGAKMVTSHMASPLSRGLFAQAIAKSGAAFAQESWWDRKAAEAYGYQFTERMATSLEGLRALSAQTLLDATVINTAEADTGEARVFWPVVDGHFLRGRPEAVFAAGEQAKVPLLLGGDFDENRYRRAFKFEEPITEKWRNTLKAMFHARADEAWAFYPGHDKEEAIRSAKLLTADLKGNSEIWRMMELHRAARQPTYFYLYTHPIPHRRGVQLDEENLTDGLHATGVEHALDNLDIQPLFDWTPADREVSRIFSGYVTQFVKTGDPNGPRLPDWQAARDQENGVLRQVIRSVTLTEAAREAPRHAFIHSALEERP